MRTPHVILLLGLAAALIGCSRAVPTEFPNASAASLEAAEGPRARVDRVLTEEPPLPGEALDGWEALEPASDPAGVSSGHHDHGGRAHAH